MKPIHSLTINERIYAIDHSHVQDLSFDPKQTYVFDLEHLGAIEVAGQNAVDFLQGQLTCDVKAITPTQMRPGGICSLQGRLLALLDVVAWRNQLFMLMPKDLLTITQQNLAKTAMFSRINLNTNPLISCLGFYIPQSTIPACLPAPLPNTAWQVTQDSDSYCYAISPELLVLVVANPKHKESILAEFAPEQRRGSLAWHYLELQQHRMTIYPNTRGLFLPHRLNLQTTAYISFNKGCYKGQEIIARTHYRSKLKHSLKLFQITHSEPMFAGQKCFTADQTIQIGELIDFCPLGGDQHLIALSILIDPPDHVCFESHTSPVILHPKG